MEFSELELGNSAKDKVTGFSGVIIAWTVWLNKCVRVALKPTMLKDNKTVEEEWFDIQQIAPVKKKNVFAGAANKTKPKVTGGPQRDPQF